MLKVKIILCDKIGGETIVAKFVRVSEANICASLLQSLTTTEGYMYYVEYKNRRHLAASRIISNPI